jgi:hypothetical protein
VRTALLAPVRIALRTALRTDCTQISPLMRVATGA